MPSHFAHVTVVHGRYDIRILFKQCASLCQSGLGSVSLFVADDMGDEQWEGVKIRDVGKHGFGRFGRAVLGSIAMWRALREVRPALVQVHDPELLPLALALRATGTRVVFDMHENLPKEILTKEWISKPLRWLLSRFAGAFQRFACNLIPTVFAETSYAVDFPSARAGVVVLNYPLLGRLREIRPPKAPTFTIGYIGVVSVERGAEVATNAIERINEAGISAHGLFVGPVAGELATRIAFSRAVATGKVELTGRLAPTDGWPLIATCWVGIAVLGSSPNFVDSYPTKLFEYMALGLPVVVSDFPLWRAIVDGCGCGLLVDPSDASAVSAALRWMYEHPERALEMGARGRAAALANYSWDSQFEKLADLYRTLFPRDCGLQTI
jgi:glycosyltransferase involved in cell wall biosynthesis